MILRINTKNEIIWPLVILYLLLNSVINTEMLVVTLAAGIIYYIFKIRKIKLPQIPVLIPLVAIYIFDIILGITKYSARMIVRDSFYALFTIVVIVFGYYLYYVYADYKSLWKTVVFMTFLVSMYILITGIPKALFEYSSITTFRNGFSSGITGCSLLFPLLIFKRFFKKEKTLGKWIDIFVILTFGLQIILNLSRTALLNVIVTFGILLILSIINDSTSVKLKSIFKMIIVVIVAIISYVMVLSIMPSDTKELFNDKINNSFHEINSSNDYFTVKEAMEDWRGYEIKCAKEQWKKSSTFEQFFGGGFGTIVRINLIPDGWNETVEKQYGYYGITVLHNSYYSLLVKGGLVTIVIIILFWLLNIVKGFRNLKIPTLNEDASLLIVGSIIILINAYIIMGLFGRGSYIGTLLFIGWANAHINEHKNKKGNKNETITE